METGRTLRTGRILVTGGAGFIGSALVTALARRGRRVTVVDDLSAGRESNLEEAIESGNVTLHAEDVRSTRMDDVLRTASPDVVVHLAAHTDVASSTEDPTKDAAINIVGTLNVLESARKAGVHRIVVASSSAIYGHSDTLPVEESSRAAPVSPYGISKRVAGDYLSFYRTARAIRSVILVLANVYGPRQGPANEGGVVSIFLKAMQDGRPTTIFGDGRQTRDFLYVEDAVDAFLCSLVRGEGLINIGTGLETSVIDLWGACATLTAYGEKPVFAPPRPAEVRRSALDVSRARRELGWRSRTSLPDGLRRAMAVGRIQ